MGIFDDLFGPDKEEIKKAYGEGVKDYDKADLVDKIFHGIGDDINEDFHWRGKKEQAHEAGWHDRQEGKVDWIRIEPDSPHSQSSATSSRERSYGSSGSTNSSDTTVGGIILKVIAYIIAVPIYIVIGIFVLAFVCLILMWILLLLVAAFKSLTGTL